MSITTIEHKLSLRGESLTESWVAECKCGWRSNVFFQDFDGSVLPRNQRQACIDTLTARWEKHVRG